MNHHFDVLYVNDDDNVYILKYEFSLESKIHMFILGMIF